ncbi:ParB-like nuclease domain containing protein [Cellulophaga phage phi47:1]|uniref:ParB-like partition protein n=1 Tax=Cellulophaga phage phiSM TaxID=756280 RepID=UPI0002B79781|nr:ParB-like partition protein [Cellulophaga phage phiSM]AGF91619.1 hypothetical protein CDPG_00015 [Cellulophaga phage phi47:1]AGO47782.1 ParB-like nuclease domain containing protein [Cellulophaga phage phi3ST:2]AGO49290.1 ParB-like nuclease domain containing protein [Cellulophaga phage phi38:2]AGO49370.1 ParB-like nuclease domain containing protein [Cellulophaga phage phi3:1]AGH07800.1 hypothetical protein CEPG_00052 [Cellulophaga phage phiSM]
MEQININDIVIPEWSFKNINVDDFKKLEKSITEKGQLKSIIVNRKKDGTYEVVDGKVVFSILKNLDINYVWCKVFKDLTEAECQLLYLQVDFYFENNYVQIAKALKRINKKISKYEITKFTVFSYDEVQELLLLNKFDFKKYQKEVPETSVNLF